MAWVAICERLRPLMGRNENKTYINVLTSTRQLSPATSAADFVTNNPTHPWADPLFNEFIIDLTDQQASDMNDGTNPLTHDGRQNNPRWQQLTEGSGSAPAFGSWADPESDLTTWTLGTPIPDDRLIVRIFQEAGTINHVGSEEFDESATTPLVSRWLKLYSSTDVASTTNAQNQRTEIAGKLMDFDFTSGVAEFSIRVSKAGQQVFPSNHQYRVVGPAGEKDYSWKVFGKILDVQEE